MQSSPSRMVSFALATAVMSGLALTPRAVGQSKERASQAISFDAASLKPGGQEFNPYVSWRMNGGPGSDDPGRITYTQISLLRLVTTAWDLQEYQIAGPPWFKDNSFNNKFTIIATMPPDTSKAQLRLMLQNLLMERFRMKVHHETRNFPGYELVVAQGGSKVKPTSQAPDPPGVSPLSEVDASGFAKLPPTGRSLGQTMSKDAFRVKCQAYTIAEFVEPYLRGYVGEAAGRDFGPIIDKTGLTGRYDFELEFNAGGGIPPPVGPRASISPGTGSDTVADLGGGYGSVFTAIQKQLGLKLVKVKSVPVDVLVIDSGDKAPLPN